MSEENFAVTKEPVKILPEAFEMRDDTSIIWLASAGFLINSHGKTILIDPVLMTKENQKTVSEAELNLLIPYPMKATDIPKVDIVLYTHSDVDHLGPETALVLAELSPKFIGPPPVFEKLTKLGVDPFIMEICRVGDLLEYDGISIEITPADHPWQLNNPARYGKPFRFGDCCGFIINTPDARCFFPGDTRLMEEHLMVKDIDVLAVDVSLDPYHLNHPSAILLANTMSDALLIPIHYGTYDSEKPAHIGDPNDVFAKVENANERARILAPGQPLILKNRAEVK